MKRFLRHLPEGNGLGILFQRHHFSVEMGGAGFLQASNLDGRFDFAGVPSTTLRAMVWVMLQAKSAVAVQNVVGVATGVSAATDSWGLQYNGFVDRWQLYKSDGVSYSGLFGGFSPVIGTWYGIAATMGYNFLAMDTYGLGGLIESVSVGLGDNNYNPGLRPLGVGGRTSGNGLLTGRVDSLSVSYSSLGNPAPGPVLFHGGLAPDYNELTTADLMALETLRLWADFNEPSGSASYADSSGNGSTLLLSGSGLTRQPGAGY